MKTEKVINPPFKKIEKIIFDGDNFDKISSIKQVIKDYEESKHNPKPYEKRLAKDDLTNELKKLANSAFLTDTSLMSHEHYAISSICQLIELGYSKEVKDALQSLIGIALKLKEKNEIISEITELVEANFTGLDEESEITTPLTVADEAILKIELIANLLD